MLKTLFSIFIGALFAMATFILVGIYWFFSVLARIMSVVLWPFRKLLSKVQ